MATPDPVPARTGRHPYEVSVLLAAILGGTALLAIGVLPRSVEAAMPGPMQAVWKWGLLVGGAVALAGILIRRLADGLLVELAGVVVLGIAMTMYAIAAFAYSGWAALAAGSFIAAIAAGSWWRVAQIVGDLRRAATEAERARSTGG